MPAKINRSKLIYFVGTAIIVVAVLLIVVFAVIAGGGGFDRRPKIVFSSGEATKIFDGQALTNYNYSRVGGTLEEGHVATVVVNGSRTDAGVSPNTFEVVVNDSDGQDVTNNYNIVKQYGDLTVEKRMISISTTSAHATYDGNPLTADDWFLSGEGPLAAHEIKAVVVSGSQTDVGVSKNFVSEVIITDKASGKNVSYNYEFNLFEGDLLVSARNITIRSQSAAKDYDGTPLVGPDWEIASSQGLAGGHVAKVTVNGTRTEAGRSPNTIADAIVRDASGKDVSFNYEIRLQEGELVVRGDGTQEGVTQPDPSAPRLDDSGAIGGDGESSEVKQDSLRVKSEVSGKVYLRYMSFGDYAGQNWEPAQEYPNSIMQKYSLNYTTGIALNAKGLDSYSIAVQSFGGDYLLPYYLDTADLAYEIQSGDVRNIGNGAEPYSAYYYLWDYLTDGQGESFDLGQYETAEQDYYHYVMDNYLYVPGPTLQSLSGIVSGLNASSPTIIEDVAKLVQGSATYNTRYNPAMDNTSDIAASFLLQYKEGVCRHFASAATLVYRMLGYPARYTIGYVGDTRAGEWVNIPSKNAHAWTEVYIRGLGWAQVEVTAAGFGEADEPADNGGGDGQGNQPASDTVKIKPVDVAAQYANGVRITPGNEIQGLGEFLSRGYTYQAVVTGSRATVGTGYSSITAFRLISPDGIDVTSQYDFVFGQGKLQLYITELTFGTVSLEKVYDGYPLVSAQDDFSLKKGALLSGHSFGECRVTGSQTAAGQSQNLMAIGILDSAGKDVTDFYKINYEFGILVVNPKNITVKAKDGSSDNGIPIKASGFTLETPLAAGDKITATVTGEQNKVGRSESRVESVMIVNKNGKDVTSSYSIQLINGTLEVLP